MKIGMVDVFFGTPKGHSYVNRDIMKFLMEEGHEVHLQRINNTPLGPEFIKPTSMESLPVGSGNLSKEDFVKWIDDKQLDSIFFMEYMQWWDDAYDKLDVCKEKGVKTIGFHVWEKLDFENKLEHYKKYDCIMAPTGFQTKLMRKKGLYKTVHTPWGIDFAEFDSVKKPNTETNTIKFFHCAGSGGVDNRKNTEKVIKAFELINDDSVELIITHLNAKVFSREDIIRMTKHVDVVVNTAKWDTIGLNTLESNACGRPVIVCDADPMNELVQNNVNGLTVACKIGTSEHVTCPSADVDVEDLAAKMNMLKNKLILDTLKNNSRKFAESNFDWKNNKEHFLKLFREVKK